jgi:hypothetical protein
MWGWLDLIWPSKAGGKENPASQRDRLAVVLAFVTVLVLGAGLLVSKGTRVLMPGPLASAHGGIENCSACHTKSGSGKMSWVHGLVAGDPLADSKACLTCHKMPNTAFNAHSASKAVLEESTARLLKIAAETPQPLSALAQDIAFPAHDVAAGGLFCATCHQEHQGVNFNLNKVSNEQCRSCHVVKFESFDGNHPKFESYPFKQRTPIIYDHAGHFGKHFPEVAKKDPARRIPETCSTCHDSSQDKRVMAVAPFEKTCTGCHLNQIVGKERASGPKGIAFLSLPGLDLQTLNKKKAAIGEWPDTSDAPLTPFMKVMIGRDEPGRALIKAVDSLNLQDLANASDAQIKAVTQLAWEIKRLFHDLIKGKASDVLGDLNIASGAKLSTALVADLTASIPRDVVISAQQEWLPGLATEMANRPDTRDKQQNGWSTETTQTKLSDTAPPEELPGLGTRGKSEPEADEPGEAGVKTYTTNAGPEDSEEPADSGGLKRIPLPMGTSRQIESGRNKDSEEAAPSKRTRKRDDADGTNQPEPTDGAPSAPASSGADAGKETAPRVNAPEGNASNQKDDLLNPTEEELRASKAGGSGPPAANTEPDGAQSTGSADASGPDNNSAAESDAATAPRARATPVITIDSDVDPESWAEYGGWYRQDFAIYYRPTGHKDKFIYSWLFLTGPQAPKGDKGPAAAVFDYLTSKDAQGSCTKCHSVDDIAAKGRVVNFTLPSAKSKQGRFTNFIHEPHFGLLENRGCLTCHELEKASPYLKSYEQGNPLSFASNFGAVKKDLCQTCHTTGMARQDCLLCHDYHVGGVVTPIMSTKLPGQ